MCSATPGLFCVGLWDVNSGPTFEGGALSTVLPRALITIFGLIFVALPQAALELTSSQPQIHRAGITGVSHHAWPYT